MGTNSRTSHQSYVVAPTAPALPPDPVDAPDEAADEAAEAADSGAPVVEQLELVSSHASSEPSVEPLQEPADAPVSMARCPHCGQFVGLADHVCPIWLARNRDYRSEHGRITCPPISLLQEHLAVGDDPVMVRLNGYMHGHNVHGQVPVTGPEVPFDPTTATEHLRCQCGQPNCSHTQLVAAEFIDRLRASRIRTPDRRATNAVLDQLAVEHRESVAAQRTSATNRPAEEVSFVDDPEAFQAAYTAARERIRNGQAAVPYQTENATGGLGARGTGRGFGVELEFDVPLRHNTTATITAIAEDLNRAGLSQHRSMVGYHAGRRDGYSDARDTWRLESDSTVSGEIVSPILYDTPETWRDLSTVCDIIRRHGGTASIRAGSHVHVSAHNYDHTVENHNRLVRLVDSYSDTLFRIASNPSRGRHRGTSWCRPNTVPAQGYHSVESARSSSSGHHLAINLQAVSGRSSDHVEYRMWDASLDPAVIQSQIKVSLGLTEAAFRDARSSRAVNDGRTDRLGSHRTRFGTGRQRGEQWREATRSFRSLMDTVFHRRSDKEQLTGLFATTRWQ